MHHSSLDLTDALQLIISHSSVCSTEQVNLDDALGRVLAENLQAQIPQPGFDQSTRDGFVLADDGVALSSGKRQYRLEGEVAAGSNKQFLIKPATASRIMTGGLVPENGSRVIPFESCFEDDGYIVVDQEFITGPQTFIRRQGSDINIDDPIMESGEVVGVDHLALLASTSTFSFNVRRKAKVSFFCTGSELLKESDTVTPGKKVSANRYLLSGLISSFGAIADDRGVVPDQADELGRMLQSVKKDQNDLIISTGGMGPGKYDLLQQLFVEAGGEVLYNSLTVRPGKSTLFGLLESKIFFGLPGPPPAVRALFNELIRPALLTMQGVKDVLPGSVQALLSEDIVLNKEAILGLKSGVLGFDQGRCTVRLTKRLEIPNCYLLLEPGKDHYRIGEWITVHRTDSPFPPS